MGKTEKGAIWLDETLCSPWEYWQFWRNTSDKDVPKFLKLFTEIDLSEIKKLEKLKGEELNEAKKILATEATTLLHGKTNAIQSLNAAEDVFEKNKFENSLPSVEIERHIIKKSISIVELFSISGSLLSSKSEARRLIRGGGAKLNNETIKDENLIIDQSFFLNKDSIKLSAGKKRHINIKLK